MEMITVTIEITGPERVRFLHIGTHHGIVFRRVQMGEDRILCQVSAADCRRLCELRHKAEIRIRIRKRHGFFFWLKKNRSRKMAWIWACLAFGSLYLLSLFVWDISFEGNVRYTDSYLLRYVSELGYEPGIWIGGVSCSDLEKEIRSDYSDITWVSARIEGTRLVIQIREGEAVGQAEKEQTVSSLAATKSGIVTRMVTREGIPQVEIGEEVNQGTILVSGEIPILNDSLETDHYRYCQASADVWIRYGSWFEYRVNRQQIRRIYEKTVTGPGLRIGSQVIFLPQIKTNGKQEVMIEQDPIRLFENFYLPCFVLRRTLRTYREEPVICSDEELNRQVTERFLAYLENLEKIGVEIIENNVTIDMNEEFCLMKGTLVLEENAVRSVPIEAVPTPDNEM
ncbi:MAG: sporulation protein YqfD [Lachnospiraceae bacterium]|nr:sporulation protein YqfD [Lachnospiraceae bacterium]